MLLIIVLYILIYKFFKLYLIFWKYLYIKHDLLIQNNWTDPIYIPIGILDLYYIKSLFSNKFSLCYYHPEKSKSGYIIQTIVSDLLYLQYFKSSLSLNELEDHFKSIKQYIELKYI